MEHRGTPRFEPIPDRPVRRWLVLLALVAGGAVAALGTALAMPERWSQTAEIDAPPVVPPHRVGAYLDAVEDVVARPSAQAEAARSVGVQPASVEIEVSRAELDQLIVAAQASGSREAAGTITALTRAGFQNARAQEQQAAAERLERAVTDTQVTEAQATVDALAELEPTGADGVVRLTEASHTRGWAVVVAAGLAVGALAAAVVARLERARSLRGYQRTPDVFEVRSRSDPAPAPPPPADEVRVADDDLMPAGIPMPSGRPHKRRIAGLDQEAIPMPPVAPERDPGVPLDLTLRLDTRPSGRPEPHRYRRHRP